MLQYRHVISAPVDRSSVSRSIGYSDIMMVICQGAVLNLALANHMLLAQTLLPSLLKWDDVLFKAPPPPPRKHGRMCAQRDLYAIEDINHVVMQCQVLRDNDIECFKTIGRHTTVLEDNL